MTNDFVCEDFPAFSLVRSGLGFFHGENRIEKKNTLLSPAREVAVSLWYFDVEIRFNFFENVLKAWWFRKKFVGNRKAQTDGLARAMIGILPQDHDTDIRIIHCLKGS